MTPTILAWLFPSAVTLSAVTNALQITDNSGWRHELCAVVQTLDNKIKEYEVERHALFFTDADAKRIYKENVKYTVLRKNSVNGRIYKDDPTIFSWGLLNEPRCETWKVRQRFPPRLYVCTVWHGVHS